MNDASNAKGTIADKIHQAVNSLLETELRLNRELGEARQMIGHHEDEIVQLRHQLNAEREARQKLEEIIDKVADLVAKEAGPR